ncbi:hypothetical protein JCM19233_5970 [Vibrio astriarenae]|nr:hypothetical protein JCM19233_5970 [Vibrio sp. C7]
MSMRTVLVTTSLLFSAYGHASVCDALPSHSELTKALKASVATTSEEKNGGLELNMWGSIVARDGTVCAVSRTGDHYGDQWPGSRVISAQKANTANAFSLPKLALSTANLWAPTQPGGSLFGLQFSNPVDINVAYKGEAEKYGTSDDAMVGERIGGVNVFGGGLALYGNDGTILGAIGVSGDTSCADHNIAWKTRHALKLDYVPGGVSDTGDDNIIYTEGHGFGHVNCGNGEADVAMKLPEMYPVSK